MIVNEEKKLIIGINAHVWEVKQGKVIAIKYNDLVYQLRIQQNRKKGKVKEAYLKKWIRENDIQRFKLKHFYNAYPKFERRDYQKRLEQTISRMIMKNELIQLGNDEFQVL